MALIVKDKDPQDEDADNSIESVVMPAEVRHATERIMVFQDWDITEAVATAKKANDVLLANSLSSIIGGESVGQRFVTANGMYQPITEIEVG